MLWELCCGVMLWAGLAGDLVLPQIPELVLIDCEHGSIGPNDVEGWRWPAKRGRCRFLRRGLKTLA